MATIRALLPAELDDVAALSLIVYWLDGLHRAGGIGRALQQATAATPRRCWRCRLTGRRRVRM